MFIKEINALHKIWSRRRGVVIVFVLLQMFFVSLAMAEGDVKNTERAEVSTKEESSLQFAPDNELKFKQADGVGFSLFFNIMLILAFITLLLYGVLYLVKKQGLMGLPKDEDNKKIKTLGIKRLSGKTVLFHLEIDGNRFVICHNDNSINVQQVISAEQKEDL